MAEYVSNPVQLVQPGQAVLLDATIPCTKGFVIHRAGSGIFTLRGACGGCNRFARYQVTFNGNIALPDGATAQPIAIGIALNGEPVQTSKAIVTPTVADAYFNVTSTAFIDVDAGCCDVISVQNESEAVGTAAAPAINVQNANLVITRTA